MADPFDTQPNTDPSPESDPSDGGQPNNTPAEPPSRRVYQISDAEPDWSEYTDPPPPTFTLDKDEAPPPEQDPNEAWRNTWAVIREVGETVILTLIIFLVIQMFVRNFRVVGHSMDDNLQNGQYLIIEKVSYSTILNDWLEMGGPQRGDVIVFEPPTDPDQDYVKRVIGLPGETVEIQNGQIFVNGVLLDQPYEPRATTYTMSAQVVPEGSVFVLGDNRDQSRDSHEWGALPMENIVGRAWISYWPPPSWGIIPRDAPTEDATLHHFIQNIVPGANAETDEEPAQ